ncbi:MAG: ABC transporter permease [Chloroflexia bacterium]|nr:ABC transporter permease [Chloroflexia bacterium]
MLKLVLRHLRRYIRLHLALCLGLTLAALMLAGLPAYGDLIGTQSLHEMVRSYRAPSARHVLISTKEGARLEPVLYDLIVERLGEILVERIEVRQIKLSVWEPPYTGGTAPPPPKFHYVRLWAFQDLAQEVRVLQGRLPVYQASDPSSTAVSPPVLEVALGVEAIPRSELGVGDLVTVTTPQGPVVLDIVGVIEAREAQADRWWGDPATFGIHIKLLGRSREIVTVSLFVPPAAMQDYLIEHDLSWRLLVDSSRITVGNVRRIHQALIYLQAQMRNHGAELHSALPQILADFQAKQAAMQATLFLLIAQALLLVLYVIWIVASYLLADAAGEMATLLDRGASRLQVTGILALAGLPLALLAALLGTLGAWALLRLWAASTAGAIAPRLSPASWGLALLGAGLGWLAAVLSAYMQTAGSSLRPRRWPVSPEARPLWQRLYLDLILLALGALLLWQLAQSGSFVLHRIGGSALADPFLLLGSSVLLVAVVLLFARALPAMLRLAGRMADRGRGWVLPLALARRSYARIETVRIVLLVTVAASLLLFSSAFGASLRAAQLETARQRTCADLRLSARQPAAEAAALGLADRPGVLAVSPVVRSEALDGPMGPVELLAIDPETFARVAYDPRDAGSAPPLDELVQALRGEAAEGVLPAIVSPSLLTSEQAVGDRISFSLGYQDLTFEIRAVADDFPTLAEDFVVTERRALGGQVNLNTWSFRLGEIWLATDPAHHDALAQDPALAEHIQADVQAELRHLQSDALARGATDAFQVNGLILGLLSVAGVFLVHRFAARNNTYEFCLLRAMGWARGQMIRLFILEGVVTVGLGLLIGTVIGYSVSKISLHYVLRAMAASFGQVEIRQVVVDWPAVLRLESILAACYVAALAAFRPALLRLWGRAGLAQLSEE